METPAWVDKIVTEVCTKYEHCLPVVRTRQSRKSPLSSGSAYLKHNRIVVTFGTAGLDQKQVLLHELAHLLNHKLHHKGGHGKEFYLILKDLLLTYDCLTEEHKTREQGKHKAASIL